MNDKALATHKAEREIAQFQKLFSPDTPVMYSGFILLTLALAKAVNYIPTSVDTLLLGFVGAVALVVAFAHRNRQRRQLQLLTFTVSRQPPSGARGLILLVSPFDPRVQALRDPEVLQPKIATLLARPAETLSAEDWETVNLMGSNLRPQVEAVRFHMEQGRLHDVWLIHSERDETAQGSGTAAQLLEQYLQRHYSSIRVHRDGYGVPAWNYGELWKKAEEIFRTSGLANEAIVADVTGGTKMMSVALATACVAPGRRMQYMDTERDWQGQPLGRGTSVPVMVDVEPLLYGSR